MSDLLESTVEALHTLPPELTVFLISALPIFEIRLGVIAGIHLELPLPSILLWGFLGNIASVTPILFFLEPLTRWLQGNKLADRLFHWLFARVRRKADQVNRWGPLGLAIFTAVPLPGSGAWTATFISILLGIHRGRAIASIYAGILAAGLVVSAAAFGGIAGVRAFTGTP